MSIFNSVKRWQIKSFTRGTCRAMLVSFCVFEAQRKKGKIEVRLYSDLAAKALSTRPRWKMIEENVFERDFGEKIIIKKKDTLADVVLNIILIEMQKSILNDNKPEEIFYLIIDEFKKFFSASENITEEVVKRNEKLQAIQSTIMQNKTQKGDFEK